MEKYPKGIDRLYISVIAKTKTNAETQKKLYLL